MTAGGQDGWETRLYRLRLESPLGTPLQSDTLFGHICWQVALTEGPDGVDAFLRPFLEGEPPFILSDAFPAGLLPKPTWPGAGAGAGDEDPRAAHDRRKRSAKAAFLTKDDFIRLCADPAWLVEPLADPWQKEIIPHAVPSRLTGATGGEDKGGFYFTEPWVLPGREVDLYARLRLGWADRLADWLAAIGRQGFGRDKSSGLGRLTLTGHRPAPELGGPSAADGLVILSTYLPARTDPTEGYWRLRLKLGRLGESAGGGRPFKKPILELEPGSVFRCPDPAGRPWLGRLGQGLAPGQPAAVQNGQALTCPCRWPEESAL